MVKQCAFFGIDKDVAPNLGCWDECDGGSCSKNEDIANRLTYRGIVIVPRESKAKLDKGKNARLSCARSGETVFTCNRAS
jgi:hypothetical protein